MQIDNNNDYVSIQHRKESRNIFDVYLCGDINESIIYTDLFHILRTATEVDVINIYINSPGGYLHTGVQILAAIKGCHGVVRTILDGCAYSMASFIFLAGDEVVLMPHSRWMAHHFSGAYYGKASDTAVNMESDLNHFKALCEEYYDKFLTKAEIKSILDGRDMWLDTKEIEKRLEKL